MVCLVTPPHPAFVGGDEITEIPSSRLEKPITEEIEKPERPERDPGDRRVTAGQTEQQVIRQADRETQITSSCEIDRGGTPPPLDLDGEVEMQGGDNGEAGDQPYNGFEDIEEPSQPTLARENVIKAPENEVDMREEKSCGEKRGMSECGEGPGNGKLRRREGIKRNLREITPTSYEEYEDSWDLEDQSKKCKRAANCLLASCDCRDGSEPIGNEKGELPVHTLSGGVAEVGRRAGTREAGREQIRDEEADLPVHTTPGAGAELDRRVGTRAEAGTLTSLDNAGTGQYSDTAAVQNAAQSAGDLNYTTDTVSQLYSKPRRFRSPWSQRILRTMLTLILFISSVCSVGGNSDWRESACKIREFDYNTPTMINELHLPYVCFIPERKWPKKLAAAKPAWTLEIEAEEPVTLEPSRVSFPPGCSRNWCVDVPKRYSLDDQAKTCPLKRIRPVNLRTDENNLRISDELFM